MVKTTPTAKYVEDLKKKRPLLLEVAQHELMGADLMIEWLNCELEKAKKRNRRWKEILKEWQLINSADDKVKGIWKP